MHFQQGAFGGVPVDAGVGDRDAVFEFCVVFGDGLAAGVDVALHHQADDGSIAA